MLSLSLSNVLVLVVVVVVVAVAVVVVAVIAHLQDALLALQPFGQLHPDVEEADVAVLRRHRVALVGEVEDMPA